MDFYTLIMRESDLSYLPTANLNIETETGTTSETQFDTLGEDGGESDTETFEPQGDPLFQSSPRTDNVEELVDQLAFLKEQNDEGMAECAMMLELAEAVFHFLKSSTATIGSRIWCKTLVDLISVDRALDVTFLTWLCKKLGIERVSRIRQRITHWIQISDGF